MWALFHVAPDSDRAPAPVVRPLPAAVGTGDRAGTAGTQPTAAAKTYGRLSWPISWSKQYVHSSKDVHGRGITMVRQRRAGGGAWASGQIYAMLEGKDYAGKVGDVPL